MAEVRRVGLVSAQSEWVKIHPQNIKPRNKDTT